MKITNVDIDNSVFDEVTFEVGTQKVTIKAHNPHGFYKVYFEKGRVPDHLKGNYTNRKLAEEEVKTYFAAKNPILFNLA